jgi:hypothetical protein
MRSDILFVNVNHSAGVVFVTTEETDNTVEGFGPCTDQAKMVNERVRELAQKWGYKAHSW